MQLLALSTYSQPVEHIACIDMNDTAAYGCENLLDSISGIVVVTEMKPRNPTVPQPYYYKSTTTAAPVDYYFKDRAKLAINQCGDSVTEFCDQSGDALFFTVTYPQNYDYASCPALPCIAMFHPGGYKESNGNGDGFSEYVNAFAKRGYVVFNVQYRTGWRSTCFKGAVDENAPDQVLAAYRGAQDVRAALKTIKKMQMDGKFNGKQYKFDLDHLYIGGASAGAFACINMAYMDQDEVAYAAPGVMSLLGKLDSPLVGKYYYDDAIVTMPVIQGVLGMWGAGSYEAGSNANRAIFIDDPNGDGNLSDIPPFIGFHGKKDVVAPYLSRPETFLKDKASECSGPLTLTYKIPDIIAETGFTSYGGLGIYNRLQQLGIPTEIYLDSDMGHGISIPESDFGLNSPSEKELIEYMIGRAATFFQAVVCHREQSFQRTKFEDLKNCRYGKVPETFNPCPANIRDLCKQQAARPGRSNLSVAQPPGLVIVPNPAMEEFTLSLKNNSLISTIRICDFYGRVLFMKKVNATMVNIRRDAIGKWPAGIYYVEVMSDKYTLRGKLELQ